MNLASISTDTLRYELAKREGLDLEKRIGVGGHVVELRLPRATGYDYIRITTTRDDATGSTVLISAAEAEELIRSLRAMVGECRR